MSDFESVWQQIRLRIKVGTIVPNWTQKHEYDGKKIPILSIDDNGIIVKAFSGTPIFVPKEDFHTVWGFWQSYLREIVKRKDIADLVRTSTYVISILKFMGQN